MTSIGALTVVIGADTQGLKQGLGEAEKGLAKFAGVLGGPIGRLATLAAAASAAGAALAVGLTARSMEVIDRQSKLAYSLGGTVESLQSLTHAADLAGVSSEELAKSVGRMNQRFAEAARTGKGDTYEALRRMGLAAQDLLKLNVDERMAVLADRFKALGYTTAQQAEVLKNFGVRGQAMLTVFEGGGASIRAARDDVKAFGVALSNIDAIKVEQANDAWTTAKLLFTGIGNQLAVQLAPIIKGLGDEFAEAGRKSGGFSETIAGGLAGAITLTGAFADQVRKLSIAWAAAEVVAGGALNLILAIYQKIADLSRQQSPEWMIEHARRAIEFAKATGASTEKIKELQATLGQLEGANTFASKLEGDIVAARKAYEDAQAKFNALMTAPMPSEALDSWLERVRTAAQAAAKEVADARQQMLDLNSRGGARTDSLSSEERKALQERLDNLRKSIANEDEALRVQREQELQKLREFEQKRAVTIDEAQKLRAQIQEKFDEKMRELIQAKLEDGILSEDEILKRKYDKQLAELQKFENNRTNTTAEAAEFRRKIEEKYALDVLKLHAAQYSAVASVVDTAMGQITELIGREGDKQFFIFKAIAAATAMVKGYEAAVSAWANGEKIAPGLGYVMAGIAAAGTGAYIAKLMGVGPRSGGNVSAASGSAGAGAAAAATAGPAVPQQVVSLTVHGDYFGREQVRALAQKLIEYQRDGGKLVLV